MERVVSHRAEAFGGHRLLIFSTNKRERLRSQEDLDAMLKKLSMPLENPMLFLNQEEIKQLVTGKEEDKYAFFVQATKHKIKENLMKYLVHRIDRWRQLQDQIAGFMNLAFGNFSKHTFLL